MSMTKQSRPHADDVRLHLVDDSTNVVLSAHIHDVEYTRQPAALVPTR